MQITESKTSFQLNALDMREIQMTIEIQIKHSFLFFGEQA